MNRLIVCFQSHASITNHTTTSSKLLNSSGNTLEWTTWSFPRFGQHKTTTAQSLVENVRRKSRSREWLKFVSRSSFVRGSFESTAWNCARLVRWCCYSEFHLWAGVSMFWSESHPFICPEVKLPTIYWMLLFLQTHDASELLRQSKFYETCLEKLCMFITVWPGDLFSNLVSEVTWHCSS